MRALPDFIPPMFGEVASLSIELANEPYSFDDNGLRPEIIKQRQRFFFEICNQDQTVSCSIGPHVIRESYRSGYADDIPVPEKRMSNVSVVTVYDTYGLQTAYSYLKHLYYNKTRTEPKWLATYLRGSLYVLNPKSESLYRNLSNLEQITILSTQILLYLAAIEMKQSYVSNQSQSSNVQLPDEVLSRILTSKRISHSVNQSIKDVQCSTEPTEDELWNVKRSDDSRRTIRRTTDNAMFNHSGKIEWYLVRVGSDFKLTVDRDKTRPRAIPAQYAKIAEYPLNDYEAIYRNRQCNVPVSMKRLFQEISYHLSTVHEDNLLEACGWLVQLSSEGFGNEGIFHGLVGLGDQVHKLVQAAIDSY